MKCASLHLHITAYEGIGLTVWLALEGKRHKSLNQGDANGPLVSVESAVSANTPGRTLRSPTEACISSMLMAPNPKPMPLSARTISHSTVLYTLVAAKVPPFAL